MGVTSDSHLSYVDCNDGLNTEGISHQRDFTHRLFYSKLKHFKAQRERKACFDKMRKTFVVAHPPIAFVFTWVSRNVATETRQRALDKRCLPRTKTMPGKKREKSFPCNPQEGSSTVCQGNYEKSPSSAQTQMVAARPITSERSRGKHRKFSHFIFCMSQP